MDNIIIKRYHVYMDDLLPGDVTEQGTRNTAFKDDDRTNPVAQTDGVGGTRNMRMEIGPGFYSSPVPGERLQGVEQDGGMYCIGGTNVDAVEKIAPSRGQRGMYCVNADGDIVAHISMTSEGTVTVQTEAADISILESGEISMNGGNLRVLP